MHTVEECMAGDIIKNILLGAIKLYKYAISPLLPDSCRFVPTCSEYSAEAIERYGAVKGSYLSLKRILRCHPFHNGGYDPVR
jgi:putative membrane protein insertion efficiency factor